MRYRIAFIKANLGRTGGNFVLYDMMNLLFEEGHKVFLVTPWSSVVWKPDLTPDDLEREQSFLYRISRTSPVKPLKKIALNLLTFDPFLAQKFWMSRLLHNWVQVDIAIATHAISAFPVYIKQRKKEIHRGFLYIQGYEPDFFDHQTWSAHIEHIYRLPLHHIWNSTWLKEKIKNIAPSASGSVVYPFFRFEQFPPLPLRNRPYTDQIHIAVYADWRPVKGLKDAIRAIQKVEKVYPGKIHWHFWGPAKLRLPFSATYTDHGYIPRKKLASFFHKVHLFWLPSRRESFPLSPVESMASGTPVLVPDAGTEDILTDGVGWTFPPGDIHAMAQTIIEILRYLDVLISASDKSIQRVRRFSLERSRTMLLQALLDGLSASKTSSLSHLSS